jgi:hypothetical protein
MKVNDYEKREIILCLLDDQQKKYGDLYWNDWRFDL